jgi:hypothetical protein
MLTDVLIELYRRDLDKLKAEIAAYADDADIWKKAPGIANPAGNLCLHLSGNLDHFFGAVLGNTGYVRHRDAEFSTTGVNKADLLAGVDRTLETVVSTLKNLSDDDLEKIYPLEVFDRPMTTGFFLTHLATHLNWHLGQINYHRRLLSGVIG